MFSPWIAILQYQCGDHYSFAGKELKLSTEKRLSILLIQGVEVGS